MIEYRIPQDTQHDGGEMREYLMEEVGREGKDWDFPYHLRRWDLRGAVLRIKDNYALIKFMWYFNLADKNK